MILRSLELRHFGRFGERNFEFRPGLNLVVGANEAGKLTLMAAIPAVLFGVRDKERFKPWGRQGSCAAVLTFEQGGCTRRIERDILADQVKLTEIDALRQPLRDFEGKVSPQGRSSERTEYLDQLQYFFGITEEDVFRASLFFGQGSLEISGAGMAGKIKGLLSGFAEVDYDRVLQSLQDDYFAITRTSPWGKDKTRNRELDEVRQRIAELERQWYTAQGALKELEALRVRIGELQSGIETDRSEYQKGEHYLAWVRKQWQLEEKQVVLRKDFTRVNRQSEKVAELQQQKRSLEKELTQSGLPRSIPGQLPLLLAETEEVRQALIPLQKESAAIRQALLAHAQPPWQPSVALTMLFLIIAAGTAWLRPGMLLPLLGGGLPALVVWGLYLRRALAKKRERNRFKAQGGIVEARRQELQARLAELDERFQLIGLSPSAVDIARMQKNLPRHQEIVTRLREVESALTVLEKEEELSGEKDQLTRELAVLDERRERERPLQPNLLPPDALPDAEDKLAALGESLSEREKQLLELTRREAAMQGELGSVQQIEEEGERLKEQEERLARRKNALAIAFDLLAGAVDEFRRTYLERFATEIGYYLQMTTAGGYERVRLDEDFSLWLPGRGGEWQPVEQFSRGTVDGVYLAVRLALTKHLSQGVQLPLFLDDPLVNLDRHRLAGALKMLERLAGEHQVILFTHNESLARRAPRDRWHVISLDEAQASAPVRTVKKNELDGQMSFI